jgi:hypothetical protein
MSISSWYSEFVITSESAQEALRADRKLLTGLLPENQKKHEVIHLSLSILPEESKKGENGILLVFQTCQFFLKDGVLDCTLCPLFSVRQRDCLDLREKALGGSPEELIQLYRGVK